MNIQEDEDLLYLAKSTNELVSVSVIRADADSNVVEINAPGIGLLCVKRSELYQIPDACYCDWHVHTAMKYSARKIGWLALSIALLVIVLIDTMARQDVCLIVEPSVVLSTEGWMCVAGFLFSLFFYFRNKQNCRAMLNNDSDYVGEH